MRLYYAVMILSYLNKCDRFSTCYQTLVYLDCFHQLVLSGMGCAEYSSEEHPGKKKK